MYYHITKKSSNVKTGPIPVTTSSADTCPSVCPFKGQGCYADSGPLKLHWDKVTNQSRGIDLLDLCSEIEKLPQGQLWRHNQAGDLPGTDNDIDANAIADLLTANIGKRGYTYTHKPMNTSKNRNIIRLANKTGFVINLSSNNPSHADELIALNIAPVVTIIPGDSPKVSKTPRGVKILTCPAQDSDNINCSSCKLCANVNRKFVIGFKSHGSSSKKLDRASVEYESK